MWLLQMLLKIGNICVSISHANVFGHLEVSWGYILVFLILIPKFVLVMCISYLMISGTYGLEEFSHSGILQEGIRAYY